MTKECISYNVVSSDKVSTLIIKVNEAIEKGWVPFGSPFVRGGYVYQSIVLEV